MPKTSKICQHKLFLHFQSITDLISEFRKSATNHIIKFNLKLASRFSNKYEMSETESSYSLLNYLIWSRQTRKADLSLFTSLVVRPLSSAMLPIITAALYCGNSKIQSKDHDRCHQLSCFNCMKNLKYRIKTN